MYVHISRLQLVSKEAVSADNNIYIYYILIITWDK